MIFSKPPYKEKEGSYYGQAISVLGIRGISTFCKSWVQFWGEYFLQFDVSS